MSFGKYSGLNLGQIQARRQTESGHIGGTVQRTIRLVVIVTLASLTAAPIAAQAVGDSVRVKTAAADPWVYGRLARSDGVSLTVRSFPDDRAFPRARLERVEVWKKKNRGVAILLGMVAGGGGWAIGASADGERIPMTTKTGDIAIASAVGGLLGLAMAEFTPGDWHRAKK